MSLDGFLDAVGPDLIRENAFRVTGLGVRATAREVRRREQELAVRSKLGAAAAGGSPLPLDPPPDRQEVQNALQRLRDPVLRLADELLWFWPLEPDTEDEALGLLRAGRADEAEAVWDLASGRAAAIASHNLAVLAQIRVMESAVFSTALWEASFDRWSELFADDGFWDVLAARVSELNDPRLASVTSGGIRRKLPERLLSLAAGGAVKLALAGETADALALVELMYDSELAGDQVVDETLRKAFDFEFARVRGLAEDLKRNVSAERATEIAGLIDAFLGQVAPALERLRSVLPDQLVRDLSNEVAETVVVCTVLSLKFVKDLKTARRLFTAASFHARAADLVEAIEGNLEAVESGLLFETCWFCKANEQNEGTALEKTLYGNVRREYDRLGRTRVVWDRQTVRIPRCASCKAEHESVGKPYLIGCFAEFAMVVAAAVCFFNGATGAGFSLVVVAIVAFSVLAGRQGGLAEKRQSSFLEFPPLRDLFSTGWVLGSGPPGVR